MRKLLALALLAALPACGHAGSPAVRTVTIWAPGDYRSVRTLTYDENTQRMHSTWLSVDRTYALPQRAFPSVPVDALRWVAKNGGFDQPIATAENSSIVGVRIVLDSGERLETRFASAWSFDESEQLKRVQSWYSTAMFKADYYDRSDWHLALYRAIEKRRVRQIRFAHKSYLLVVNADGTARIAVRRGEGDTFAHGRFDWRALVPVYNAALLLRQRAPVLQEHDPSTRVTIVTPGRTFVVSGSDDVGLEIFSARLDQLAHDIHWNRLVDL